jgi:hypothetical protein
VYTIRCALTRNEIVQASGTAAIKAFRKRTFPVLVQHREALMAALHPDHEIFVHGIRNLIASRDPNRQRPDRARSVALPHEGRPLTAAESARPAHYPAARHKRQGGTRESFSLNAL